MKKYNLIRIVTILSVFIFAACAAEVSTETTSRTFSLLSLPDSNFEIDDDANILINNEGYEDWGSVDEYKTTDIPSGKNDNSFKGGSKENTTCPGIETGSIPNNKSDLKSFGIYREPGSPGFLHLFWSRVQDPTGTTLIDFELNQSTDDCGNGVNVVRTPGDILLEYRLEQGGQRATIKSRSWTGDEWGEETNLTELGVATGTINNTVILEEDSDGLGQFSERTFGEASVDLSFIFNENQCTSFGSAFVKSRSSDSFNSALKDFIAPADINVSNCGEITIRKTTQPAGLVEKFTFNHNLKADPALSSNSFVLGDGESVTFSNILLGQNYSITENLPADYKLVNIDCSNSTGVTTQTDLSNQTVTFNINNVSDNVDCTFTNKLNRAALVIEKYRKHAADGDGYHPQSNVTFTVKGNETTLQVTTNENGSVCVPSLPLGEYSVTELVPEGYSAAVVTQTVSLINDSNCETAEKLIFLNNPLTDVMCTVKSQIEGGTVSNIDCLVEPNSGDSYSISSNTTGDETVSLNGVLPGTYTCTITVEP